MLECLDALCPQAQSAGAEVIVADSSDDGTDEVLLQAFREIRFLHFSDPLTLPELRNPRWFPWGDWPFLPSVRCKACFRRKGLAARGRSAQTARNLLINRLDSTQIFQQQVFCHGLLADVAITGWWFLRQHWARSVSYSCWDASCLTRGTVLRRRIVQHSKLMVGSAVTLLTKILLEWLRSERLWSSCG